MGNTHFHAQPSFFVLVTTVRLATCDMEARASPRNPYVVRWERSENLDSLEVVKRCASIGRSDFYPLPRGLNDRRASSEPERAHLDPASVVLYLKQFHTAVLDRDANGCGAGIQAVLEELLEGRCRSVYDLREWEG